MLDMKIKQLFFDTAKVKRAVDSARRRVLSKAGAFIRRRAKSSIRKRKATSAPGQPPSSHTGILKRFIYFGYEPSTDSVVIGPVRLQKLGDAPSALEHGGKTVVRRRKGRKFVKKKTKIKSRPFMEPALVAERKNLPELWRNSVR